jgi:HD superfamily phosphodiesterase
MRALIGVAAATLLLTAVPASAHAQSDEAPTRTAVTDEARGDRLERAKAHLTGQIERRLRTIDQLTAKVTQARFITDGHEAALLRDYAAADEILIAGIDAVTGVETIEELREIAPPIFERTLVYALLSPKTHAVVASDAVVGVADRANGAAERLQKALDRLEEAGVESVEELAARSWPRPDQK